MADQEQLSLPRAIDDPPQLMLWSADELMPMLTCVGIGIMINHFFVMLFVGVALWRLLRRFKDSRPDGYMLHFVYWLGLVLSRSRVLPNPFRRRWLG